MEAGEVEMASKVITKTTYKEYDSIQPFYTGGEITANANGSFFASTVDDEDCLIVESSSGRPLCRIDGDGETITSLALTPDASFVIICSRSLSMRIFQLSHFDDNISAELLRTLKPHTTPVVASTVDTTGSLLVTGGADGIVKVWDIRGGYCSHTFHGHGGVITAVEIFESDSSQIKSGLGSLKKGKAQESMANGTPKANALFLASSGEDGRIKIHNLNSRQQIASLESHASVVRSLKFSPEQDLLLSASRDRTIVLWDVRSWTAKKITPTSEELEAAGFILGGQYMYAGGENGRLRVWSTQTGRELQMGAQDGLQDDAIVSIFPAPPRNTLYAVRGDQVIELLSYDAIEQHGPHAKSPITCLRTFSGNYDEVIDIACIGQNLLAICDNTETVKIVSTFTGEDSDTTSRLGSNIASLHGHQDVVLCMDVDMSGAWLATGSKDNTAALWNVDLHSSKPWTRVATFKGHTASLGAVSLPKSSQRKAQLPPFLITGSEDKTIKRWNLSDITVGNALLEPVDVAKATFTRVAHEKDINAIDTSPIAPIFASASQDRTIKIWSAENGSTAAVLRGHKRGVWSVRFSPTGTPALNLAEGGSSGGRGLLISGSGDNTVKVWSLNTYACLLTFEGHQNSVLKVLWLPPPSKEAANDSRPVQSNHQNKPMIASASSDTLIKLWSPYTSADGDHLLTTLDGHTDRVWSLAAPLSDVMSQTGAADLKLSYNLISGAADAKICFWTDTTATTTEESSRALTERVEQDQLLQNHIIAKNYKEVITLSLALNHPGRLLRVFEDVINLPGGEKDINSIMGVQAVDDVLATLNQEQIYKLLEKIRDWNTNARTAAVAQKVLNCLLRKYPQSMWTDMARDRNILKLAKSTARGPSGGNAMKDMFRALEAYTDRHYKRMEDLIDESYLLEYTLREMDEIAVTTLATNGVDGTSEDVVIV